MGQVQSICIMNRNADIKEMPAYFESEQTPSNTVKYSSEHTENVNFNHN